MTFVTPTSSDVQQKQMLRVQAGERKVIEAFMMSTVPAAHPDLSVGSEMASAQVLSGFIGVKAEHHGGHCAVGPWSVSVHATSKWSLEIKFDLGE